MQSTQFDLGPNYQNHFSFEFKQSICDALTRAYNNASQDHIPTHGADGSVHGNMIWRYNAKEIKDIFRDHPSARVVEKNNRLRVYIGDYKIGFAKVGTTGREDIENLFPGNMNNVLELADSQESQLSFFDHPDIEIPMLNLRSLIIIHQGNAQDGLRIVHACFPVYKDAEAEDKIIKWAHIEKIWDINDEDINKTFISPKAIEKSPVEKVQPPVLKLKEESQQVSK